MPGRCNDEIKISLEKVSKEPKETKEPEDAPNKLTTSKLAQKLGVKTHELVEELVGLGYLEANNGKHYIKAKGKEAGGEFKRSPKYSPFFIWPENLIV